MPLLAPLLGVLIAAALNPAPAVRLRLLVWQSPALPLGGWIAATAAAGAALSAGGTALALRESASTPLRRRVQREPGRDGLWDEPEARERRWEEAPPPRRQESSETRNQRERGSESWRWQPNVDAGPTRAPGEPAPTLSVPYRVIRRGGGGDDIEGNGTVWSTNAEMDPVAESGSRREGRSRSHGARPERMAEPVPAGDDWGDTSLEDW